MGRIDSIMVMVTTTFTQLRAVAPRQVQMECNSAGSPCEFFMNFVLRLPSIGSLT
jgi:hypothetical protein